MLCWAVEDQSDEERAELVKLTEEAQALEPQIRAAIVANGDGPELRPEEDGDGEARERRELRSKAKVHRYLSAAIDMRAVDGAEAEYTAAEGMKTGAFPLRLLAPEIRQTTNANPTTNAGPWLDRIFAASAAMRLGVTMRSVPPGVASFPVTTAGAGASNSKTEAKSLRRPRGRLASMK